MKTSEAAVTRKRSGLDDGPPNSIMTPKDVERAERIRAAAPEMLKALKAALALWQKDHALSRFNWGESGLRAEDIRELNELPLQIRKAITKAEGALCNSESPEPSTYCTFELGHEGQCSWEGGVK